MSSLGNKNNAKIKAYKKAIVFNKIGSNFLEVWYFLELYRLYVYIYKHLFIIIWGELQKI